MAMLLDANVLMELLRQRPAWQTVEQLIRVGTGNLTISDFALHAIGVACWRHKVLHVYRQFIVDMIEPNRIAVHVTDPEFMLVVVDTAIRQKLDFDDAYQYAIAERDDLVIISLDADFDRTTRGRLTPEQALQKFQP